MRRAFTLLELLLVIAILGIAAAVTIPAFVRSMRGNRLRAAARSMVMAGRYARSMALLQQREVTLTFDLQKATVAVRPAGAAPPAPAVEDDDGSEGPAPLPPAEAQPPLDEPAPGPLPGADPGAAGVTRELDRVRLEWVELADGRRVTEGSCSVRYRSNGTCGPYRVRVVDEHDAWYEIRVDALGTAETESDTGTGP